MARIGNGHGTSEMAVPCYERMITKFGEAELREVALLLTDREFSSRVGLRSCLSNFRALLGRLVPRTTNQVTQQAFAQIQGATDAQIPNLGKDSAYMRLLGLR